VTPNEKDKPEEGRFVRHTRVVKRLAREPRFAFPLLRDWFLGLWATRGGGFYGLGYVVTLVTLESISFEQDAVKGASSLSRAESFIASQAIQYITKFGVDSIMNGIRAAVWPAYLFDWLGPPGILVFVAGGMVFERVVRPAVEARFPELAAARAARVKAKQEKRDRKRAARAERPVETSTNDDARG
jgi:hypothetical protein